eukprot:CAMPEP_0114556888 /NCGR_PEP_ID=MMETSP0114-20121206/9527_1 /TAXON_ID=31324 /ORGANISM="Goniomonas sp, Strain m" /LENGTH=125 /DNA_ID=CAMNT_0001742119 /DNA_START=54 /DNA_END=431 /DNA_ORIENTATION=-
MAAESDAGAETKTGPMLSGWLTKKGAIFKTWNKRWFVLTPTEIQYYGSETDAIPKSSIKIKDCKSVKSGPSANWDAPNSFVVVTAARTYFIIAHNEQDKFKWIQGIGQAIIKSKPEALWDGEPDY